MTSTETATTVPADLPARRSGLALLLGILAWPRSTFAYLRDHGGWSWLLPVLLALALTLVARLVAVPIERAEAEAARAALEAQLAEQSGGVPGDGVMVGAPTGAIGGLPMLAGAGAGANPLVNYGLPLAGVLWDWGLRGGVLLALAWLLGGRPVAGAMFRMSGWTMVPEIARLLVALGVMLAAGRVPARGLAGLTTTAAPVVSSQGEGEAPPPGEDQVVISGPGGVAAGGPSFVDLLRLNFLGALDIYTVWLLGLLVVGVAVTARLGWLRAGLATLVYWGISLSLAALPTLLSFWVMSLAGPGGEPPLP